MNSSLSIFHSYTKLHSELPKNIYDQEKRIVEFYFWYTLFIKVISQDHVQWCLNRKFLNAETGKQVDNRTQKRKRTLVPLHNN